jgi:uncharacterized protein YecT (DUF1311 family)
MFRVRHLFASLHGLATVILVGSCVLAIAAVGQTQVAELSEDCAAYASVTLPAEAAKVAVPKTPPACASYRSYRGIGRPVNYSEARACAWQERLALKNGLWHNQQESNAWVIGGSLILADIYFNGAGVKRNVPLAMRFACEFEKGTAKLALSDIAKQNGAPRTHKPFEFCDYAATTFTMNFCGGYASEIDDDRKSRYYNSLKSSMTQEQKAAFEKLLTAKDAYIKAHGLEVDQGGTIRGLRTLGSESILRDLFHTELVHFERKKWPVHSEREIATVNAVLHREYEKKINELRTRTKEEIEQGAVTADGLAGVQKSWEKYRDAWVAFARVRYPAAVDVIRAEIVLDRYRLVKTID